MRRKMHVEATPLGRFFREWNGTLDPDAAYEAACALQVPVELWPEFCLTVLIGGLRAAQPPETTEPPSKFA